MQRESVKRLEAGPKDQIWERRASGKQARDDNPVQGQRAQIGRRRGEVKQQDKSPAIRDLTFERGPLQEVPVILCRSSTESTEIKTLKIKISDLQE